MDHTRISISISIWCCHLILLSQLISQGQTAVQLLFIWCWKRKTASALAQHKERIPWKPIRGTGANEAAAGRTRQRRKRTIQEPQSQAPPPIPPRPVPSKHTPRLRVGSSSSDPTATGMACGGERRSASSSAAAAAGAAWGVAVEGSRRR